MNKLYLHTDQRVSVYFLLYSSPDISHTFKHTQIPCVQFIFVTLESLAYFIEPSALECAHIKLYSSAVALNQDSTAASNDALPPAAVVSTQVCRSSTQ